MAHMVEHLNINKVIFMDSHGYLFLEIAGILDLGIIKDQDSKSKMLDKGDRVLIVDDIISTGESILDTMELITGFDAFPVAALSCVYLTDECFMKSVEEINIPIYSLFYCNKDVSLKSDLPFYPMIEYASQNLKDCRTVVMSHPDSYSLASNIIDQDTSNYRYGNTQFDANLRDREVIYVMSMHDLLSLWNNYLLL